MYRNEFDLLCCFEAYNTSKINAKRTLYFDQKCYSSIPDISPLVLSTKPSQNPLWRCITQGLQAAVYGIYY